MNESTREQSQFPARLIAAVAIVFAVAALRLNQSMNFAPIGALALFCGLTFRDKKAAILLPLLTRIAGDFVLGWRNDNLQVHVFNDMMLVIYLATIPYVFCGLGARRLWQWEKQSGGTGNEGRPPLLRGGLRLLALGACALGGAVCFHVISNLAFWAMGPGYAKTTAGLVECFVKAQPFFRKTAVSDLVFSFSIVGIWAAVRLFVSADVRSARALYSSE